LSNEFGIIFCWICYLLALFLAGGFLRPEASANFERKKMFKDGDVGDLIALIIVITLCIGGLHSCGVF
jgi:hypothetical protein